MLAVGGMTGEPTGSAPDHGRRLPGSRWRREPLAAGRGAAGRVARSHAQARTTIATSLAFVAAGVLAWAAGTASWLPLHLFLAGGVVLAISGVSLMLTVTWSAAPAPADRLVAIQRACVAGGAAGVVAGRQLELGDVVIGIAGIAYVGGLLLLAVLLIATARRGVERRFDPAVFAYLAALSAGTAGVALGVAMAVHGSLLRFRAAHLAVNLLGLVGLVITGTLPFFAATVGRTRMAPHATARRITVVVGWQVAAVTTAAIGLATGVEGLAAGGLAAYACGIAGVVWLAPRPTRRQLRWAGPRLVALWAGAAWWAAAVAASALAAAAGDPVFPRRWLTVLVVAGYAQILWGSLAYLLPMLRGGGHERLSAGFATTRSWVGLAAVNVVGIAAVADLSPLGAVALAVWALDTAARAIAVGFGRPGGIAPAAGGSA